MILLQRNLILDEIVENKQASENGIPELHLLIEIQLLYTTTKLEEGILNARGTYGEKTWQDGKIKQTRLAKNQTDPPLMVLLVIKW